MSTFDSDGVSEFLSGHLDWSIKESDREYGEDDAESRFVVERLVRLATSSLEGFAPAHAEQLFKFWNANPDNWKWAVDDYYSRQCVLNIPAIVRRFLKLSPVLVGRIPSDDVSVYLKEATQCFLHGLFQGCTALSRAAMEAGVNELITQRLGSAPKLDLVEKLRQLERFKLLDGKTSNDAHDVRKAGGSVLHQSPTQESIAFETLLKARRVLTTLYAR